MVHFKVKYFSVIEEKQKMIKSEKWKLTMKNKKYPKLIRNLHKFLAFYKNKKRKQNKESIKH